ncbi:MAG: hypothetical protein ABXS91_08715 [Sulfurimonas sp.]
MRPSIKELCGLDPAMLVGVPKDEADANIIDALHAAKDEIAIRINELDREMGTYNEISILNARMNYISKAILARKKDLEEMGIEYRRTK